MNKVILSGNLTRDPEVKYSNGEKATCACRFNVAVRRKFKNSEGKYDADFINCVAFGPTGEFIGKFFKTGNGIEIIGTIRTGSYTNKDGVKVYTTDVYVDEAGFPASGGNNAENGGRPTPQDAYMAIPDSAGDEGLPFN